jgi:hypothetical protein
MCRADPSQRYSVTSHPDLKLDQQPADLNMCAVRSHG